MNSIIQKYNRKVKEGFSKKLPTWALILIIVALVCVAIIFYNYYKTRALY
mgnify:CR=1 FL=1